MKSKHRAADKKQIVSFAVLIVSVAVLYIATLFADTNIPNLPEKDELGVWFIDSGQADSALIRIPGGGNVMIDTGLYENRFILSQYLRSLGVDKIDYLILSHPHSDHIGGACEIIDCFQVENLIVPYIPENNTYASDNTMSDKVLSLAKSKTFSVSSPEEGHVLYVGDASFTFISSNKQYDNINDMSLVIRLDYGETSFLFTGDIENDAENGILSGNYAKLLDTDILKVAHHGSASSSSVDFISAVTPDYAVISCGKNNDFGHPHRTTLYNLEQSGSVILRTDTDGTVIFSSDGSSLRCLNGILKSA